MNPLKKGPQLKAPEMRMPPFLVDLYHDLQDRHLLPVVGLLLVGIVAVPLLLGGSSGSDETAVPTPATAGGAPAKTSALVVTKEAADLRDYKRRLGHLTAKDPFVSPGGGESGAEEGAAEGSGGGGGEVTVSGEEETVSGGGESGGAPSGVPSNGSSQSEVVYFTYAVDVRVVPVSANGKPSKAEPSVRRDLPPLTMLPSRAVPALTYMGPSKDGKKAMMLVSDGVTSLFGDSACVVGSESCQLLALEPNLPETVVFGANARTYRVELLDIKVQTTDHLNRAPLGKPKPRGNG